MLGPEKTLDRKNFRGNPRAIARHLTDAFEKGDLGGVLDAVKFVLQAQNVKEIAEITGMRRDGLYKTFLTGKKDPRLSRILCLFGGMDVRIVVKPLPARAKPPRPKLGRPRSPSKKRQGS